MTTFPETLTIPIDNNELKLLSINKDGESAQYLYTKSKTKQGTTVTFTIKQIKNLYQPTVLNDKNKQP